MDSQQTASRFDWIQWLTTIPGVPSDWGLKCPDQAASADQPDEMLLGEEWAERKAA